MESIEKPSGLRVRTCGSCGRRVMATMENKCPSCQAPISEADAQAINEEKTQGVDALPDDAINKANAITADAKFAPFVGFLLITWPYFVMRLVQWYLVSKRYPALVTNDPRTKNFRRARNSLWIGAAGPPLVLPIVFFLNWLGWL